MMKRIRNLYNQANDNLNSSIEGFEFQNLEKGNKSMLNARKNFQDIVQIIDDSMGLNDNLIVHSSLMYNKGRCKGLIEKIDICQHILDGKEEGDINRILRILRGDE